jgi:hypothetical protein
VRPSAEAVATVSVETGLSQRAGHGGAARLAARKSCAVFLAGKTEFFEQI